MPAHQTVHIWGMFDARPASHQVVVHHAAADSPAKWAAEFYGVAKDSSVALGYQAMMEDLGLTMAVRVWMGSTASMGICGRRGLGKLHHIDTQCLWT